MAREKRRIEWERLLGRKAWQIAEVAPMLGLSYRSARRYLERAYNAKRLDRSREGRYMYFAVALFLQKPLTSYVCPNIECFQEVEVFKRACGCMFHIHDYPSEHDIFKYCKNHIIVT